MPKLQFPFHTGNFDIRLFINSVDFFSSSTLFIASTLAFSACSTAFTFDILTSSSGPERLRFFLRCSLAALSASSRLCCPDCEYLLHTEDGNRFLYRNYYDSYWTPLVEQIGIDHTPHCTRHTCISMLSEAGVQDTTIKKIVGHSGAMTLTEKVYTHLNMQVLVDAINKTLENETTVIADAESA